MNNTGKFSRRSWITSVSLGLGAFSAIVPGALAASRKGKSGMIVLYCDLAVIPSKEQQMLDVFHKQFRPAAEKFKGFVDLKILKYSHRVQGPPPPDRINYRFQLTYESLELQQVWVKSKVHQALWPLMAATLSNPDDFQVLVFNNA